MAPPPPSHDCVFDVSTSGVVKNGRTWGCHRFPVDSTLYYYEFLSLAMLVFESTFLVYFESTFLITVCLMDLFASLYCLPFLSVYSSGGFKKCSLIFFVKL